MRSQRRSLPSSWAQVFGFFVVALMIAAGSCRFNRLKAQDDGDGIIYDPLKKMCDPAYLESVHGADWHIWYALNGCWIMDGNAAKTKTGQPSRPAVYVRPQFRIGGR